MPETEARPEANTPIESGALPVETAPSMTQADVHELIGKLSSSLAQLLQTLPASREASLATTKLDEFFFWISNARARGAA